jgi:hypothetical protein
MPYAGLLPKSGCKNVAAAFMLARYAAELASTADAEMSVFHGLSAGKMRQPATVGALLTGGAVGDDVGAVVGTVDGCAAGVGIATGNEPPPLEATVPPPPPHAASRRTSRGMTAARRPKTRMTVGCAPPGRCNPLGAADL